MKYHAGEREDQFEYIASVYQNVLTSCEISTGTAPCLIAEDEIFVKRSMRWVAKQDILLGFCGPKADHACISDFVVKVGDFPTAYERVVCAFKDNMIAHYARILIINPHQSRLPRLVVFIQLTCNSFDAQFVRIQWSKVLLDAHS